jgi:hypothetical protein
MSYSQDDFYSDDPVEGSASPVKKKFPGFVAFLLLIFVGGSFLQTTLAANISLNSGSPVEFGQGVTQAVACSGATNLRITPNSSFVNASGGGAYYFSSVTVANVPTSCYGKDFTIKAFNDTSSAALAIFNTSSTSAVVYNNSGTFEAGSGSAGLTVSSGSGTFTVTFTSPVALSSTVYKLTVESGPQSAIIYNVGDFGPGGGRIFYKDLAGFDCGPTFSSTGSPSGGKCNYLEVAPNTWITPSDSTTVLLGNRNDAVQISGVRLDGSAVYDANDIGLGYKNSIAIRTDSRAIANTGIRYVRDYNGGSLTDWYLPNSTELNILVYWSKGLTPVVNVRTTSTAAIINGNFTSAYYYYSSSQTGANPFGAHIQSFNNGASVTNQWSDPNMRVRPIRAF